MEIFVSLKTDPFEISRELRSVLEPIFSKKFQFVLKSYENLLANNSEVALSDLPEFSTSPVRVNEENLKEKLYDEILRIYKSDDFEDSYANFYYEVELFPNSFGERPFVLLFSNEAFFYIDYLLKHKIVEKYPDWLQSEDGRAMLENETDLTEFLSNRNFNDLPYEYRLIIAPPSFSQLENLLKDK